MNDPYEDIVTIYAQLECDKCFDLLHAIPGNPHATDAEIGAYGKSLGWYANWDDYENPICLCPKCVEKKNEELQ